MKSTVWVVLAALVSAPAWAEEPASPAAKTGAKPAAPPPPPGRVLFVRGGTTLVEIAGDGSGEKELGTLPAEIGVPEAIEASPNAGLVVVRGDRGSAWQVAGETTWRTGCPGRAHPSPTNECLVCEADGKVILLGAKTAMRLELPGSYRDVGFLGSARELASLGDDGVIGFSVKAPHEARALTAKGPTGHLLVSPSGELGVAVFGHGKTSRVHGFLLDGQGVPRNLGGPGVPVVWSWDSVWVLIDAGVPDEAPEGGEGGEEGDDGDRGEDGGGGEDGADEGAANPFLLGAPAKGKKDAKKGKKKPAAPKEEPRAKIRTCVVRAVGGQSKCWSHFAGRGFAPSGDRVLLAKGGALWIGKIAGVRPDPPRKLVEKADGPSVWVP